MVISCIDYSLVFLFQVLVFILIATSFISCIFGYLVVVRFFCLFVNIHLFIVLSLIINYYVFP